jgi:hypothetical protein
VSSFYRLTAPWDLENLDTDDQSGIVEIVYRSGLFLEIDPRERSLLDFALNPPEFLAADLQFKVLDSF